jgi:hypothetical protein
MFKTFLTYECEKRIFEKYNYDKNIYRITDLIKWYIKISIDFDYIDFDIESIDRAYLYFPEFDDDGDSLGMICFHRKEK